MVYQFAIQEKKKICVYTYIYCTQKEKYLISVYKSLRHTNLKNQLQTIEAYLIKKKHFFFCSFHWCGFFFILKNKKKCLLNDCSKTKHIYFYLLLLYNQSDLSDKFLKFETFCTSLCRLIWNKITMNYVKKFVT